MIDLKKVSDNREPVLFLTEEQYNKLHKHLLPRSTRLEECAFIFADLIFEGTNTKFMYKDSYYLSENDYITRSEFHLEIKDSIRAMIIKKAHDLNCCVIETHSHIGQKIAEFSFSDWSGLFDFVPHILWRLKGKPYISLVFTTRNFDALVWFEGFEKPSALKGIQVGPVLITPTGESLKNRHYGE